MAQLCFLSALFVVLESAMGAMVKVTSYGPKVKILSLWIFVAIALIPFVISDPSDNADSPDDNDWYYGEDQRGFPFRLYRGEKYFALSMLKSTVHENPESNCFISPHSAYRALLLAYFGAEGKIKKTMKKSLYLSWAKRSKYVASAYQDALAAGSERFLTNNPEFKSVDRLYVSKTMELKSSITDLLPDSIQKVSFRYHPDSRRREINAWVEDFTKGNIKDLLREGSIQKSTTGVLVNAAYFKGFWEKKFDKEQTQVKTFNGATPTEVEMMAIKDEFNYGFLPDVNANYLELPYDGEDGTITMFIYLPCENTATAVDDLLAKMTPNTIQVAFSSDNKQKVDVELPKINLDKNYDLRTILENMGFTNLFGNSLTGFSDNMSVSFDDMVHSAKIDVDEDGTVAAAATASVGRGIDIYEEFHCDHPFIFTINDILTQQILFAGVYREPNLKV